jgi:hypothetical protein
MALLSKNRFLRRKVAKLSAALRLHENVIGFLTQAVPAGDLTLIHSERNLDQQFQRHIICIVGRRVIRAERDQTCANSICKTVKRGFGVEVAR